VSSTHSPGRVPPFVLQLTSNSPSHGPAQVARQSVLDFSTAVTTTYAATNPLHNFVRNKIAQLVSAFVAAYYPDGWPDAIRKFIIPLASDETTLGSLDLFFRVLHALDDDITSIHAAQISESARLISVLVKDAIRIDCTQEFVEILATLVAVPASHNTTLSSLGCNYQSNIQDAYLLP
jgi:hypothetical protein